ncbi:MAG: UDP-N-acetylmuramoyl-L-alanine--D-glutamate ligase, partial [Coriobacteriia bacterium]|nr:UDP-N-acetylmuramoyl-L-alanine--D-glutamate ligase [Coriobacteriia bacterium]
ALIFVFYHVRFIFKQTELIEDYDLAVVSPGISPFSEFYSSALLHAKEVIGEVELAWRLSNDVWIAITGSNGKTTTTALITQMLEDAGKSSYAVGNIGEPCVSEVHRLCLDSQLDYLVSEVSSFQLYSTSSFAPRIAILLNITPDHLEWHKSFTHYANSKKKIFANLSETDLAISNYDDEHLRPLHRELINENKRLVLVSEREFTESPTKEDFDHKLAGWVQDNALHLRWEEKTFKLIDIADMRLKGLHNYFNALCASLAALELGISIEEIVSTLKAFKALEHRIEYVTHVDGIAYYNDSKATNTDATIKAINSFASKEIVLLLGGHDKGGDLEHFSHLATQRCKAIVCYGEAQQRFLDSLTQTAEADQTALASADHMLDAVLVASSLAEKGDVILLSPACSSFDEFSGFEERGRIFKEFVNKQAQVSLQG